MLSIFSTNAPIEAQINYIKHHETQYNKINGLCMNLFTLLMYASNENLSSIEDAICYVRDINKGRGQKELTYSLLYTYHDFYPERAIELLKKIVYYDFVNPSIGCWKDVKQFAEFVAKYKGIRYISNILNLYVRQLKIDYNIWSTSVNMNARDCISFAAKYVPRETKNPLFYEICVNLWCEIDINCGNIMKTACLNVTAINKCRMLFRKMVAELNRALDTTEIKLCDKNSELINITKVPRHALFKYKSNLYRYNAEYYDKVMNSPYTFNPYMIIKHCMNDADKEPWNKLWESLFTHVYITKNYYVPLLDLSESLFAHENKHKLYNALAQAIIYARCSYISNSVIVAFNNTFFNVDLEGCDLDLCLQRLQCHVLVFNKESCILHGLSIVLGGVITSHMTNVDIDKLRIVLITPCEIKQEKFDSILTLWSLSGIQNISEPYVFGEKNVIKIVL
jgi:hypothetical protein